MHRQYIMIQCYILPKSAFPNMEVRNIAPSKKRQTPTADMSINSKVEENTARMTYKPLEVQLFVLYL